MAAGFFFLFLPLPISSGEDERASDGRTNACDVAPHGASEKPKAGGVRTPINTNATPPFMHEISGRLGREGEILSPSVDEDNFCLLSVGLTRHSGRVLYQ